MKIQGPASPKTQPSKSPKSGKRDGLFKSLLAREVTAAQSSAVAGHQESEQHNPQQRWQLVEEAALLLDQALEQLAAGEKPAEEIVASIQQLRLQLHQPHQSSGDVTDSLNQANAILAAEAERIHALNR